MPMPPGRRLLIVDDDPEMLLFLSEALASPAWQIATAPDAMGAFIKARDLRPFMILTDMRMPSFGSGLDMVNALRLEKAVAATPVLVLTGMDAERAKRLVPEGDPLLRLMFKPADIDVIFRHIRELTGVDGAAPGSAAS